MQLLIKVIISMAIILAATAIGKKLPSTAGLIGVMPLAGALILVWMYLENKGDSNVMQEFTKGALGEFCQAFFSILWLSFASRSNSRCRSFLCQVLVYG